jgi:hypothetical protein
MPLDVDIPLPSRDGPGKTSKAENQSGPDEFPIPFAVSGIKPKLADRPDAAGSKGLKSPVPQRSSPLDQSQGAETKPPARTVRPAPTGAGSLPPLPGGSVEADDADDVTAVKKKPRKPVKLDPAILQRALQLRNQGRQD